MNEEEISNYKEKVTKDPINIDEWKTGVENKTLKIAVIGIGTQTDRMRVFFNSSIASYDLKQFVNLFRNQISEVYETIF